MFLWLAFITACVGNSASLRREETVTKFAYQKLDPPPRLVSASQKEKYEKHYAVAPPESEPQRTHIIPPILNSFRGKYFI